MSPARVADHSQPARKYVPALDGMRALAVLMVMLFHAGFVAFGWVGVQLFFVLSGFLITSILLGETELDLSLYLKRFYWRRTLRIFPLYFAFLFVIVAASVVFGSTPAFRQQWPYLLTYTFNIARLLPDYVYPRFWGHLWSLAVEEQFYVVWPVLLYFVPRRWFPQTMASILVAAPLFRLGVDVYLRQRGMGPGETGYIIYNLMPSQIDAFAMGALLAGIKARAWHRWPIVAFCASTALMVGLGEMAHAVWGGGGWPGLSFGYTLNLALEYQPIWGYTVLNLWGAAMVVALLYENLFTRLLSTTVPVALGRISYGLYVLHLPVLVLFRSVLHLPVGARSPMGLAALAGFMLTTTGASALSFRFLETPFLNLKNARYRSIAHSDAVEPRADALVRG